VKLTCARCRRAIAPGDDMVAVIVGQPRRWQDAQHAAARLDAAPRRWHYYCAPKAVRQYASPVTDDDQGIEASPLSWALAGTVVTAVVNATGTAMGIVDLVLRLAGGGRVQPFTL